MHVIRAMDGIGGTVGAAASDAPHAHTIAHDHRWSRRDGTDDHWDTSDASGTLVRVRAGVRDFADGDRRDHPLARED